MTEFEFTNFQVRLRHLESQKSRAPRSVVGISQRGPKGVWAPLPPVAARTDSKTASSEARTPSFARLFQHGSEETVEGVGALFLK